MATTPLIHDVERVPPRSPSGTLPKRISPPIRADGGRRGTAVCGPRRLRTTSTPQSAPCRSPISPSTTCCWF
jgi:hypothetical protein